MPSKFAAMGACVAACIGLFAAVFSVATLSQLARRSVHELMLITTLNCYVEDSWVHLGAGQAQCGADVISNGRHKHLAPSLRMFALTADEPKNALPLRLACASPQLCDDMVYYPHCLGHMLAM